MTKVLSHRIVLDIARVVHEAMRTYQTISGDPFPAPPFDEAPASMIDGVVDAVVQVSLKDLGPEEVHDLWVVNKRAAGWTYGPIKDYQRLQHPCLVSWNQLPEEERRKDALFVGIVKALTAELPDVEEVAFHD